MREEVFALPWPPSANTSKFRGKGRKQFVSTKELRTFHTIAVLTIKQLRMEPMEPPYEVTIEMHPPKTYRVWDAANFEKAVTDSLKKAGLITDDSKIVRLVLEKHKPWKRGVVMVRVREVSWDPKEWSGENV